MIRQLILRPLFFLGGICAPFSAAMAEDYKISYDVYASGFHALEVDFDLSIDDKQDKYGVNLFTATHGLLGTLVPWKGNFYAEGAILNDQYFQPLLHRSSAQWRGEEDVREYRYDEQGHFVSYKRVEEGVNKTPDSLDEKLTEGTTDVLSATLNMMAQLDGDNPCDSKADIFDGKRRFELSYSLESTSELKASRYNKFEGTAYKCIAEVEPKGGKWHKKPRGWLSIQEQGRELGKLPTIWMGKPKEIDRYIPVKVLIKTQYGAMMLHLTGAHKKVL